MWPTQSPHSRSDVLMETWELSQCQLLFAASKESLNFCCSQGCSRGPQLCHMCKAQVLGSKPWSMEFPTAVHASCSRLGRTQAGLADRHLSQLSGQHLPSCKKAGLPEYVCCRRQDVRSGQGLASLCMLQEVLYGQSLDWPVRGSKVGDAARQVRSRVPVHLHMLLGCCAAASASCPAPYSKSGGPPAAWVRCIGHSHSSPWRASA